MRANWLQTATAKVTYTCSGIRKTSVIQQWIWTSIWPSTGDSLWSVWESTSMSWSVVTGGQGSFAWTDMEVEMKQRERVSFNYILARGIDSTTTSCHCRTITFNNCCNRLCKAWLQKLSPWGVVWAVMQHQRKMLIYLSAGPRPPQPKEWMH